VYVYREHPLYYMTIIKTGYYYILVFFSKKHSGEDCALTFLGVPLFC
jgi:hypothetical protein